MFSFNIRHEIAKELTTHELWYKSEGLIENVEGGFTCTNGQTYANCLDEDYNTFKHNFDEFLEIAMKKQGDVNVDSPQDHIQAIANILKRPIITFHGNGVEDQKTMFYLPLQHSPNDCSKNPLCIGYQRKEEISSRNTSFHFIAICKQKESDRPIIPAVYHPRAVFGNRANLLKEYIDYNEDGSFFISDGLSFGDITNNNSNSVILLPSPTSIPSPLPRFFFKDYPALITRIIGSLFYEVKNELNIRLILYKSFYSIDRGVNTSLAKHTIRGEIVRLSIYNEAFYPFLDFLLKLCAVAFGEIGIECMKTVSTIWVCKVCTTQNSIDSSECTTCDYKTSEIDHLSTLYDIIKQRTETLVEFSIVPQLIDFLDKLQVFLDGTIHEPSLQQFSDGTDFWFQCPNTICSEFFKPNRPLKSFNCFNCCSEIKLRNFGNLAKICFFKRIADHMIMLNVSGSLNFLKEVGTYFMNSVKEDSQLRYVNTLYQGVLLPLKFLLPLKLPPPTSAPPSEKPSMTEEEELKKVLELSLLHLEESISAPSTTAPAPKSPKTLSRDEREQLSNWLTETKESYAKILNAKETKYSENQGRMKSQIARSVVHKRKWSEVDSENNFISEYRKWLLELNFQSIEENHDTILPPVMKRCISLTNDEDNNMDGLISVSVSAPTKLPSSSPDFIKGKIDINTVDAIRLSYILAQELLDKTDNVFAKEDV